MVKKPDRDSTLKKLTVKSDYEFEIVNAVSWSAGKYGKISGTLRAPLRMKTLNLW